MIQTKLINYIHRWTQAWQVPVLGMALADLDLAFGNSGELIKSSPLSAQSISTFAQIFQRRFYISRLSEWGKYFND
jgi:hypothetical protein